MKRRDWSVSIRVVRRVVRWERVAERVEGRVEVLRGGFLGRGWPWVSDVSLGGGKEDSGVECVIVSEPIAGDFDVTGPSFSMRAACPSVCPSILLLISSICLSISF